MKVLTTIDLLALPSLKTPPTGHVGFGAKSDGLYQKVGTVETKLAIDGHTHTIANITGLQSALDGKQATLIQGSNITITGNTISAVDTKYGVATTSANGLMSSADKSKLNGIESGANKYVHPSSHPASMITQSSSHRFVTDTEKSTWNAKSNLALGTTSTTAYRGDRGNTAYNHSQATGNPHGTTFAQISSKPTTLSGYGITDGVQINSSHWANFRYANFSIDNKDALTDGQGLIKLDGWYNLSIGAEKTYGTRLTINGQLSHDKTQLYFNGANGSIQYRKSWWNNSAWTALRTIWDSSNLTSLSQLTDNIGVASHIANKSNPHAVTKAQVGLGNVDNTADSAKNVLSATKLTTARTINGTSFNGTANITTANWGTARNIGIVNSDGTGTAVTTSVNGSANVNLKLPATIKASLTGNASSATKLQTARTIAGVSFDGTANIAIPFANLSSKPTTLAGYGISASDSLLTSNFQAKDNDLTAIAALTGTGFLKRTGTDTWSLDSNTYSLSSHTHTYLSVPDTRSIVVKPRDLFNNAFQVDFKYNTSVGNPPVPASGTYSHIISFIGWHSTEGSGGWPSQLSIGNGIAVRQAIDADTWGAWKKVWDSGNFTNLNQLTTRNFSDLQNKPTTLSGYGITDGVNKSLTLTAGNGLTGGGTLKANRTFALGTPSTLTAASTNAVTATSHTHAITTTTVGAANTIVATDASGGVRGNIIRIGGNWTLELSGTELVFKYNGVIKQRMLSNGSIVATGELTAYGATS